MGCLGLVMLLWGLGFCGSGGVVRAQELSTSAYRVPPEALECLALESRPEALEADPSRRWLLVAEAADLVPVAQLAWPEERLRALRFYPAAAARVLASDYAVFGFCPVQQPTKGMSWPTGGADDSRCRWLQPPADGARLRDPVFSPSGDALAFSALREHGLELHLLEVPAGNPRRLGTVRLNDLFGPACSFWPDGGSLLCRVAPPRPAAPTADITPPPAPEIRDATNFGGGAPASAPRGVAPHLLAALDSEVVRIHRDGSVEELAPAGPWRSARVSPDGRWVLLERLGVSNDRFLLRPLVQARGGEEAPSFLQPLTRRPGPVRQVGWRADAAATLSWIETASPGAVPQAKTPAAETLWLWGAPWGSGEGGAPTPVFSTRKRLHRVLWGGAGALAEPGNTSSGAVVEVLEPRGRQGERWFVALPSAARTEASTPREPVSLGGWSLVRPSEDPASPLTRDGLSGDPLMGLILERAADGRLWVHGREAEANGVSRPVLKLQNPATGELEVVWRSPADRFERPVAMVQPSGEAPGLLALRESAGEPGNLILHRLEGGESAVPITGWRHPTPELAAVEQRRLSYLRDDGLALSARLYLPPVETRDGEAPPLIFWAYPQDLEGADVSAVEHQPAVRSLRLDPLSPLLWLSRGYAVLEAEMPIVGGAFGEPGSAPSDSWRRQLVADAAAALDAAAATGAVDVQRAAVVGHSYGAHMAAALLAHSDLFRAGVALSGAYNRTLTPFGFQDEERSLWQAPEVYRKMSPLLDADSIEEPLLLIHGQQDAHDATRPEQSEALYEALRFLGRPARLVLLPHEGHRPRGRESVLHLLWEMDRWLEEHLARR